jgi:hypothetical protein
MWIRPKRHLFRDSMGSSASDVTKSKKGQYRATWCCPFPVHSSSHAPAFWDDRRVAAIGSISQKLPSSFQRNIDISRSFFLKHSERYRSVVLDWANEVRRLNLFDNSEPVLENISSCQPASNWVTDSLQYPLCGLDTMVLSLFKNRNAA